MPILRYMRTIGSSLLPSNPHFQRSGHAHVEMPTKGLKTLKQIKVEEKYKSVNADFASFLWISQSDCFAAGFVVQKMLVYFEVVYVR